MKPGLYMLLIFLLSLPNLKGANLRKFFFQKKPKSGIFLNNISNSNSNSVAVNTGLFGDANAFSSSTSGNNNYIIQG